MSVLLRDGSPANQWRKPHLDVILRPRCCRRCENDCGIGRGLQDEIEWYDLARYGKSSGSRGLDPRAQRIRVADSDLQSRIFNGIRRHGIPYNLIERVRSIASTRGSE